MPLNVVRTAAEASPMIRSRHDDGFTIVEAMVAVSVLAFALALTLQPMMAAMRRVNDARVILVAENLAQAEIESLRALSYDDVGLPGRTPSGVLEERREVVVEGRTYTITMEVTYAGSLTGLDVLPQGGDGVQGSWDPGVDYKLATVTVVADGRPRDPVVMKTIIAPRTIGAHEGIANARIHLAAYEPFEAGGFILPSLRLSAPSGLPISSTVRADVQVFPAIPVADYVVSLATADGWIIHPDDVLGGADRISVHAGTLVETSLRVYRPATLQIAVVDDATGAPISNARLMYRDLVRGTTTSLGPGVYEASGLIPNAYDLTVTADGYVTWTASSINIPAEYPDPIHRVTVRMSVPVPVTTTTTVPPASTTTLPTATTTTTAPTATTTTIALGPLREVRFEVKDSTGRAITGATVTVEHPNRGRLTTVTDLSGRAYLNLEERYTFTAVATTVWGHGAGSAAFDPRATQSVRVNLTRPNGLGLMALKGGSKAEFLYRVAGAQTWVVVPPNSGGEASFVGTAGNYDVAKRCTKNGNVVDTRTVSVSYNADRTVDLKTKCP